MSWQKELFARRLPRPGWKRLAVAGTGGVIVIGLLGLMSDLTQLPLLVASFGASCVLVFTLPEAPVSQPLNVVAGHLISAACGLLIAALLPVTWWSIALAVGLAIVVMATLRVTHPPAGGNPIVVMTAAASWSYLVLPILVGVLVVVLVGLLVHRLTGTVYPIRSPRPATEPLAVQPDTATRPDTAAQD